MSNDSRNVWILPDELLERTPSREDGISMDSEIIYRQNTCRFILEIGKHFKGHPLADATACALFHRFFTFQSFRKHNRFIIAVTCWFLAAKIEESPRKLRDIINAYFVVKHSSDAPTELEVKRVQEDILVAERILLATLNFDFYIEHPHTFLLKKMEELDVYMAESRRKEARQLAMNFLRDSLCSSLCLQYTSPHIAQGICFMALLQLNVHPLLHNHKQAPGASLAKSWFDIMKSSGDAIDEDTLKSICYQIVDIYEKPNWEKTKNIHSLDINISTLKTQLNDIGRKQDRKNIKSVSGSSSDLPEPFDERRNVAPSSKKKVDKVSSVPPSAPIATPEHVAPPTPVLVAPPTPQHVAPPTPQYIPPPTPQHVAAPPTPQHIPPPTPDHIPLPTPDYIPPPSPDRKIYNSPASASSSTPPVAGPVQCAMAKANAMDDTMDAPAKRIRLQ